MSRYGRPIRDVGVSNTVETGISYGSLYSEWDACVECNLDLWKWLTDVYPRDFKVTVLAFHGLRRQVHMHTEDALSKKMKSKSR